MNIFTDFIHGFFTIFGDLLAYLYGGVHNLAIAIAILTVIVLLPFTPLISKSVHNSIKQAEIMKRIHPEMKRIREEFKNDPVRRNQELQMLMSQEKINPVSGCLPMLPQFAVLWIFYAFIRGVYHVSGGKHPKIAPLYIPKNSALYHALIASGGHLKAFGMDLALKVPKPEFHSAGWIPYWIMLLIGVVFSYMQFQRSVSRMPPNPQIDPRTQQRMNLLMLVVMSFIYFIVPAAVGIYYATSAIVRLGQYEYVFWRNPTLAEYAARNRLERENALGKVVRQSKPSVQKANGKVDKPVRPTPKKRSQGKRGK
jgi:YidC/Oxa1 family membrane protein insertase